MKISKNVHLKGKTYLFQWSGSVVPSGLLMLSGGLPNWECTDWDLTDNVQVIYV